MTKIKICGITNSEDALNAAIAGAGFLGFIIEVPSSKDTISRKEAEAIIKKLPPEVQSVMVTASTKAKEITEIAKEVNPSIIQLHSDIPEKEIKVIRKALPRVKLTKKISVEDESAIREAKRFEPVADFLLLDTKLGKKSGGTGKTHDWSISAKIVKAVKKPVFLAGGLNPENVRGAISIVRPFAVDVNSGVKLKAGKKDFEKVKRFITEAKML
ncbi:phosphoribosylanthranilate isomerase [Candidatus Woesearchaeota archaeon]|nr:phosphoribosylanthranilate isomerase [Candidatus Woesearchaeota archaeon]